jgi:hypothetical protein
MEIITILVNTSDGYKDREQANEVWAKGAFVTIRTQNDVKIALFQPYSFYMEVYYNTKQNKIEWLKLFSSTEPLAPYLRSINISTLFIQ